MKTVPIKMEGFSRTHIKKELKKKNIQLNKFAEILLSDSRVLFHSQIKVIEFVVVTLDELGLSSGATLHQIFSTVEDSSFGICTIEQAVYFRLQYNQLTNSTGIKSAGRAPNHSITVLSPPIEQSDDYPKGLYIRRIDNEEWLRGYRCDSLHLFSPTDTLLLKKYKDFF